MENDTYKPWLERKEWASARIVYSEKGDLLLYWFFCICWNLISGPLWFIVPKEVSSHNYLVLLFTPFPLLGIWIMWAVVKATINRKQIGDVILQMDPYPGAIGGHVGAIIDLPFTCQSNARFSATLNCIYTYGVDARDADNKRTTDIKENVIWYKEGVALMEPSATGTRLKIRFSVPENLPSSEIPKMPYHSWHIDIESHNSELKYSRKFSIPVFATGESSSLLIVDSNDNPKMLDETNERISEICQITKISGGLELYFPMFRNWQGSLGLLIIGLIPCSIAILSFNKGHIIFALIFGIMSFAYITYSIYALFNSLHVRLNKQGLYSERRMGSLLLNSKKIMHADIVHLLISDTKIKAKLLNGEYISVSEDFRGRAAAEQALKSIVFMTGYAIDLSDKKNPNKFN